MNDMVVKKAHPFKDDDDDDDNDDDGVNRCYDIS